MTTETTKPMTIAEKFEARTKLATALACCDSEAFPGSKAARKYSQALLALDAFDKENPEVLAEINRAHRERVLGGADVLGL